MLDGIVERTFGVSGKLWHGVLVFFDRETNGLWTQLDGRMIVGEEVGSRLDHVPSTYTTWSEWKALHPDTLVLEKGEDQRDRTSSRYADYFANPDDLFVDHLADGVEVLPPKETVYGVTIDGHAWAVPVALVAERGAVNAVVAGVPIAVLHDERTGSAVAVDRRFEARVLEPEPLLDTNPAQRFRDAASGETHAVDELDAVRLDRAFWYAWTRSHPGSSVHGDAR